MTASLAAIATLAETSKFEVRAKDWRNGAVVYQVFVDRFAPSANLSAKRSLYPAPMRLRSWEETPHATAYDARLKTYPHVLDFWGGDLSSMRQKLDYIHQLGADVLYLQPIFRSPSNHKYDTEDYFQIDPQYGTSKDLADVIHDVHSKGMKIILDGVFNHIGVTSPIFTEATNNPKSKRRNWFFFDRRFASGYRGWAGVDSLPGLKLETKAVRDYLWSSKNSVVQKYLADGIDGWRLDVAFEIGHELLTDLTQAAHAAKPGSAVVGEISGYPSQWFPAVDGVFNFFAANVGVEAVNGRISGGRAGQMFGQMVADAGIENLLKSWIVTDNHDTARLADVVPNIRARGLVQLLQMTLPGSPCIYYGSELGMTGKGDPEDRAPMRWDLVNTSNLDLNWMQKLIKIRQSHRALRIGDFQTLSSDRLIAFVRTTDQLRDSVIVLVNPTGDVVRETLSTRIGKLMSWGELEDLVSGVKVRSITGLLTVEIPAHSAMILCPVTTPTKGYSPYNRIK